MSVNLICEIHTIDFYLLVRLTLRATRTVLRWPRNDFSVVRYSHATPAWALVFVRVGTMT